MRPVDGISDIGPDEWLDTDGDGLPDWWELENGLDPNNPDDGGEDPDQDDQPNKEEYIEENDPQNPDTDNDGIPDGEDKEVPAPWEEITPDLDVIPDLYTLTLNPGTSVQNQNKYHDKDPSSFQDWKQQFVWQFSDIKASVPVVFSMRLKKEQQGWPAPEADVAGAQIVDHYNYKGQNAEPPHTNFYAAPNLPALPNNQSTQVTLTDHLKKKVIKPATQDTPEEYTARFSVQNRADIEPIAMTSSEMFLTPTEEDPLQHSLAIYTNFDNSDGDFVEGELDQNGKPLSMLDNHPDDTESVNPSTNQPVYDPDLKPLYLHAPEKMKCQLWWEPSDALRVWHTPFKARTNWDGETGEYFDGQIQNGEDFVFYRQESNPVFLELLKPTPVKLYWGRKDQGLYHKLILAPITVNYIARNPETDEISDVGGIIEESQPTPFVDINIVDSYLDENHDLIIKTQITIQDALSEIIDSQKLKSLKIFVNDQLTETIDNLPSLTNQPGSHPIWQPSQFDISINKTIVVSNPRPGVHHLRLHTSKNAAGNVGWASAKVILGKNTPPLNETLVSRQIDITCSNSFSENENDHIKVSVDGLNQSELLESDINTNFFQGSVLTNNGMKNIELWIDHLENISPDQKEEFYAIADIDSEGDNTDRYSGKWLETEKDSKKFTAAYFLEKKDTPALLYNTDYQKSKQINPQGSLEPFVVQVMMPEMISAHFIEGENHFFEIQGEEVKLVSSEGVYSGEEPPEGMKYLYASYGNSPALFALVDDMKGTQFVPSGALTDGEIKTELSAKRSKSEERVFIARMREQIAASSEEENIEEQLPAAPELEYKSKDYEIKDVFFFFNLLFDEYGKQLLKMTLENGAIIEVKPLWDVSDWDGYDIDNWMQIDANKGKPLTITIDNDHETAIQAAIALYNALHDLGGPLVRYDFQSYFFDQAVEMAVANDPQGIELYQKLRARQLEAIAETIEGFTLAAEVGLSIAVEPADWVISFGYAVDEAKEGQYMQAGISAGVAIIPFLSKFLSKAGKALIAKLPWGDLKLSKEALEKIAFAYTKKTRLERMKILSEPIQQGIISPGAVRLLYECGYLRHQGKASAVLESSMKAGGKGNKPLHHAAHHDLPISDIDEFELTFLKAGLDPNYGEFGRYIPKEIHDRWSNFRRYPPGGPFNAAWRRFFEENENISALQIVTFMEKLRSGDMIPIKNLDGQIINWNFKYP